MTSRGNQSVSPTAQISQQRHVTSISSSTPPPQQYYPGSSSAIQQSGYGYFPQAQGSAYLQYQTQAQAQAYGSTFNDLRGHQGSGGRLGPTQQSLQPGANFYTHHAPNIRPPQASTMNQQYIINQAQNSIVRQQHQPSPQLMFYQQGNNVIMPAAAAAAVYPSHTVPVYQQNPYVQSPAYQSGIVYCQNGSQWRGQGIGQVPTPSLQPQKREKKVLPITDPRTGRDIIEDYINHKSHASDTDEHHEHTTTASENNKEICQTFARLVAESLKSSDDPGMSVVSSDSHGAIGSGPAPPPAPMTGQHSQQSSSQHQLQQQPSLARQPAAVMRTPVSGPPVLPQLPRPGLIQQSTPAATPPNDIQPLVDVSVPPPQFPMHQPTPVAYSSAQQPQHPPHVSHHHQQPPLQQQQQPLIRSQVPPLMPQHIQVQSPPPHQSPPCSQIPISDMTFTPASQPEKVQPVSHEKLAPLVEAAPASNIPATATPAAVPVQNSKTTSHVKDSDHVPLQTEMTDDIKPPVTASSVKTTPSFEEVQIVNKTEDKNKEETVPAGASSQGVKDGHKSKKGKKSFIHKEVSGSEMDAFIDVQNETSETQDKSSPPTVLTDNKPPPNDEPAVEDLNGAQETKSIKSKDVLPQPSSEPKITSSTQEEKEDGTFRAPQKEDKTIKNVVSAEDIVSNISTTSENQNQQLREEAESRASNLLSEQIETPESQILDNGIPEDAQNEFVVKSDLNSVSVNNHLFSDESTPLQDSLSKQEIDDLKRGQTNETSSKLSSGKTVQRVKDGKEKLQYDRAYLMELRECPSSQMKPEGLPDLEIILDRPVANSNRGTGAAPLDFTPAFFQPSGSQRHAPQIGKTNSRNRQRPDVQMPQRVIKGVSLQDSIKPLHQSENPWKPAQKQVSAGEVAEKRKSLEAEVLFIMNRLTPTNFERLATEMRKLNIETYEDLQELVKIFFDKVTMETKFVEAYAQLCKYMSSLKVTPPPNSGIKENQATFRVVMLTKCQQEFEADKTTIFEDPEEKRKKIEAEMPDTPERATLIENTLYQMKLKRLKFYGNIRFIGELFKLGMLTETIMHDCIYRLLKARDDDSLLSLCNLIATVGQNLDTEKAKPRMDGYFAQMAKIAEERKSRIKFTLKDVIDLRNNNWIPRKEQTGPKKIDEVHKDFQQEQATKQFLQSQPLPPRNETPQPNSRRGSRQRQDDKQPTDDGWNTVGSKSLRIDASKMKLSKNIVDENSIQLGPGGGMKQFAMWSRGSYGGAQPSQDNERPPAANRFSALRGEEDRRGFQRSPSRGDGVANRSMRQGPPGGAGRGKILARSSREGERMEALANARSIVGGRSQNSSRDNSWNREDRRQPIVARGSRESENPMTRSEGSLRPNSAFLMPPPAVSPPTAGSPAAGYEEDLTLKKIKPLSEKEMEHKAKTILEEYLSVMDLVEAKMCMMELAGQEHLHILVTTSINEVLEKSNKERDLTGSFFHEMLKNGLLSQEIYIKGLMEVLQYAEDMVIDIPKMWTYLAQLIVPLLIGGSVPLSTLATAFKSCLDKACCARLMAEILIIAKEKMSESDVAAMWQSSQLDWTVYMHSEEVPQFLKDKKLEFTVQPITSLETMGTTHSADLQRIADEIENIMRRGGTHSEIHSYVAKRGHADKHGKYFIRALMTAIAKVSISGSTMKLNENIIKSHKDVLQHYIKNNPEMELQALYAVQALMHKLEHPPGVIASIFGVLCEEDVIREEAFKQWEISADPQETEGKGPCIMQLTQFFAWLRENEDPETS